MKLFVGISLFVLLGLLLSNKYRPSLLFGLLALLYFCIGLLDVSSWLGGFINQSLLVLVALLCLSCALEKTLFFEWLGSLMIGRNYSLSLFRLGAVVMSISGFINNTAVVASLMGVVKNNPFHAPSKLLIPLSYFSIVGGTLTLVGTSTNLLVNSLVLEQGLEGFGMFDFLPVGGLVGLGFLALMPLLGSLLPCYKPSSKPLTSYLIGAKVRANSPLIGKSIQQNGLRQLSYFFLSEIQRDGQIIAPVSHDELIKAHDRLIFSGDISHLDRLLKIDGLELVDGATFLGLSLVEVVLCAQSPLIGLLVKDSNFRMKFDATILCFKRGDVNISQIGEAEFCAGDNLILAVGKDFYKHDNLAQHFYFLSTPQRIQSFNGYESVLLLVGFLGIIFGAAWGAFSLLKGLLVLLVGLLFMGYLSFGEIKSRFPFDLVVIVGSSLAITKVLIASGLAQDLAFLVVEGFGDFGVYGSLVGVYVLTLLLTELMSNNAAAALAFPIAFSTALALGVDVRPFVLAVIYGASACFMMPFGYQTHLMVSSLGGYRQMDFVRVGLIASLVYSALALGAIIWCFF